MSGCYGNGIDVKMLCVYNALLCNVHGFLTEQFLIVALFLFFLEIIVLLPIRIIHLTTVTLIWFSNLIFSIDTLELYHIENDTRTAITLIKKGIAWWTDKNVKFRNPKGDGNLTALFQGKKYVNVYYALI